MSTAAPALPPRREAHEPPEARGLRRDDVRMLVATRAAGVTSHARARDLPEYLHAGDVLVVNTSATLPAALPVRRADGSELRLHLSTPAAGGEPGRWVVELRRGSARFGDGHSGERLALPGGASAMLLAPYLGGARLWLATLDTGGVALLDYLAEHGAPIRYAHSSGDWPLADYQTVFALHPGSAEMPSAGRPFTPDLVTRLVARGVVVAPLTLHTGVSSLEAGEMPYPERFEVPATTARLVNGARAGGGRVIAVGTSVVRALETVALPFGHVEPEPGSTEPRGESPSPITAQRRSAAFEGVHPAGAPPIDPGPRRQQGFIHDSRWIRADSGWTRHVVTPDCGVRVVDGLLTGWHDPDASHLLLLEAVGGRALIDDSYRAALEHGYRWHEFGDVHLILP